MLIHFMYLFVFDDLTYNYKVYGLQGLNYLLLEYL